MWVSTIKTMDYVEKIQCGDNDVRFIRGDLYDKAVDELTEATAALGAIVDVLMLKAPVDPEVVNAWFTHATGVLEELMKADSP